MQCTTIATFTSIKSSALDTVGEICHYYSCIISYLTADGLRLYLNSYTAKRAHQDVLSLFVCVVSNIYCIFKIFALVRFSVAQGTLKFKGHSRSQTMTQFDYDFILFHKIEYRDVMCTQKPTEASLVTHTQHLDKKVYNDSN